MIIGPGAVPRHAGHRRAHFRDRTLARSRDRTRARSRDARPALVMVAAVAAAVLAGLFLPNASGAPGGADAVSGQPVPGSLPHPATSRSPALTWDRPAEPTTGPTDRYRRTPERSRRLVMARSVPVAAPRPSPAAYVRQPAASRPVIAVRYLVTSQGSEGFRGEIQVTNNTAQQIGDWQLVVALDDDAVTSFTNATGYVSNGILLLGPASLAQVVPPDGGVLDVFFVAVGTQTTPTACAFNGIPCG